MATRTSPDPNEPWRSPTVGINTVSNRRGHFINVFIDGAPVECLGPFEERLTIAQALITVGTQMRFDEPERS